MLVCSCVCLCARNAEGIFTYSPRTAHRPPRTIHATRYKDIKTPKKGDTKTKLVAFGAVDDGANDEEDPQWFIETDIKDKAGKRPIHVAAAEVGLGGSTMSDVNEALSVVLVAAHLLVAVHSYVAVTRRLPHATCNVLTVTAPTPHLPQGHVECVQVLVSRPGLGVRFKAKSNIGLSPFGQACEGGSRCVYHTLCTMMKCGVGAGVWAGRGLCGRALAATSLTRTLFTVY